MVALTEGGAQADHVRTRDAAPAGALTQTTDASQKRQEVASTLWDVSDY
jgi:hypothetical protein